MSKGDDSGAADQPRIFLDMVLRPHRSLSRRAFRRIMIASAAINLAIGLVFIVRGAWPIFGFLGLDVLLLWLCLKLSYRGQRFCEHVQLNEQVLLIERHNLKGPPQRWALPPNWLRVSVDDPERRASAVVLTTHGRSLRIGRFLSPEQRTEAADRLRSALDDWRRFPTANPMAG